MLLKLINNKNLIGVKLNKIRDKMMMIGLIKKMLMIYYNEKQTNFINKFTLLLIF